MHVIISILIIEILVFLCFYDRHIIVKFVEFHVGCIKRKHTFLKVNRRILLGVFFNKLRW